MKKVKSLTLVAIAAMTMGFASCSSDNDQVSEPEPEVAVVLTKDIETHAIEKTNAFSYNLLNALQDNLSQLDNKNIFVSPLSVSMAMSMAANGAVDETRDEIISALGYKDVTTMDGINQVNAKLLAELPTVDPETKLAIANALWVNKDISLFDSFKTVNEKFYDAGVQSLDFNDDNSVNVINQWVSNNTNGLINKLLSSVSPSAQLFITNALYFNSEWSQKLSCSGSQINFTNYDNTSKNVDVLESFNYMLYNTNAKCAMVTLPLGNGSYSFSAVLPNEGVSVKEAVKSLNDAMYNGVETKLVSFKMPKFDYSNDLELIDYLKALNIKRAFSSKAQFTRITNNSLMISDVRHSTKVFVNENGVEAAAATSVEFDISDSGESVTLPEHIEFFVNRPFAYVIREASTNAIVFVGAVNQL